MQNITFTFKGINENDTQVINATIYRKIDIINQSLENVVTEFEKVIFGMTDRLGYDIELHDVKENVIYKGYKHMDDDTHYLTVEIACNSVAFDTHGFLEELEGN